MSAREEPRSIARDGPDPGPGPAIRDAARRERLQVIVTALGDTEVGREVGLGRLSSLADFCASVPLRLPTAHAIEVTARLGFGLDELGDEVLTAATRERHSVCAAWRQRLGGANLERVAVLLARADDARVDQMRLDDLRAFGGDIELLRVDLMPRDPDKLITQLRSFEADTLVLPSLATCGWLEQLVRAPLERRLPRLRQLFVEHDLDERVRTKLPVINAGWFHAAGRVGLPARRKPSQAFRLATRSTLIELLPHGDPEIDPRQRMTERTVWPEAAVLGERYELVLSSPLGFLRYRSGLHVRVVGFAQPNTAPASGRGRPLPCPRVVRLPPPPADAALEGVTMAGAWLTASVRQAFLPEDPALVAADIAPDPDATHVSARTSRTGLDPFADTELGASRAAAQHRGPKPRSLVVRLEVQGQTASNFQVQISDRIDRDLCRRSAAYAWLRERDELWEPRVVIARPGTARSGREMQLRRLDGPVARPVVRLMA